MSIGSDALLAWIDAQEAFQRRKTEVYEKLARWKLKRSYERDRAQRAFSKLIREAAEHYVAQGMVRRQRATDAFPKGCCQLAAAALEKDFCGRYRAGHWAALQLEHKTAEEAKRKRAQVRGAKLLAAKDQRRRRK